MQKNQKNTLLCVLFALFFAAGFALCLFYPKQEYSDSERRKLASLPPLSVKSVISGRFMSDFEGYAQDAFPFRDAFRTIKAVTAAGVFQRLDNNGIYVADGYAAAMEYPMDTASIEYAAARLRNFAKICLTDANRVYVSVIPDKNRFMAAQSGHLSMDYEVFEQKVAAELDFARFIPISDLLERGDYYRTDTHWRQDKIVDVAERLAQGMGVSLPSDYTVHTLDRDFYGVYTGQAALPLAPDQIDYLTTPEMADYQVYDGQNNREIAVYDMKKAMGKDAYELFLSGPLSLVTIENPHAKTDRELILVRDSFGSSIAPLLAGGYAKVTLVDIRYISPQYLREFVDFSDSDVLFLYSTLVLNNSETLK